MTQCHHQIKHAKEKTKKTHKANKKQRWLSLKGNRDLALTKCLACFTCFSASVNEWLAGFWSTTYHVEKVTHSFE